MLQTVKAKKYLYIYVSNDEFRLPMCVADSIYELAEMCGVNVGSVYNGIKTFKSQKQRRRKITTRYEVVSL